ncbi:MAG: ABC transporter substrate-binding protein [Verrucomicrobiota bacterium]
MKMKPRFVTIFSILSAGLLLIASCSQSPEAEEGGEKLTKIILQTDWYAQPEHGGFYQAVANGYYEEVGLDVEIRPGGPNITTTQQLVQGNVQFGIGRSDAVAISSAQGIPITITGALMQRDPQAILFHKETGIDSFEDLDGKTVMAGPGAPFISMLEKIYDIKMNITPLDYGMSRFLGDKNFIQQCFITNEPYYVAKQGANPGTLLISDSGFSPYRVWFTSKGFARKNPEIVKAFNEASIRGWTDYLFGDRAAANELIAAANPKQTPDFMDYVHGAMVEHRLVTGEADDKSLIGHVDPARIQTELDQLTDIGMLDKEVKVEDILLPDLLEQTSVETPTEADIDLSIAFTQLGQSEVSISWMQLNSLPTKTITHSLEFDNIERPTTIAYLSDFLAEFGDDQSDFWIANCSDGYQSNYTPEIIEATKPFLILAIDNVPLPRWLHQLGHPEWGPYIINVEDDSSLLDPGHKNPWGVGEIIGTLKEKAYAGLGDNQYARGKDRFVNSCASCHDSGNGIIGGNVSTRNIQILAVFASQAEDYFRRILENPVEANPLAEKMPSYAHYTEEEIGSLISYLSSFVSS